MTKQSGARTLDEPGRTAYLLARAVARSLFLDPACAPRDGCAAAGPFPEMVCRARLVAARTPAGVAWQSPRQPFRAADCADRRGQDARGLSAVAGGAFLAHGGRWKEPDLHRPRREA